MSTTAFLEDHTEGEPETTRTTPIQDRLERIPWARLGRGIERDVAVAEQWLLIAVENGNDLSYSSLADIHADRRSPAHDSEEAFHCWLQVAERPRGDLRLDAMYWLARSCRDGIGTSQSRDEAKRWLDRILAIAPPGKSDYRHAAKLRKEIDEGLL